MSNLENSRRQARAASAERPQIEFWPFKLETYESSLSYAHCADLSENEAADPLSEVLSLLGVQTFLSRRLEGSDAWALRFCEYKHIKFGGVIRLRNFAKIPTRESDWL